MKALSLTRPWPFAFINGEDSKRKRIENRSWKPPDWVIGKYIYLHSAKSWDETDREYIAAILGIEVPDKASAQHSVIVARVRVDGYVLESNPLLDRPMKTIPFDLALPDKFQMSNWFFGPIGWVFSDVLALPSPVECGGARRLWEIPADIQAQIDSQIATK